MKFQLALFVIYLIGVDAKHKAKRSEAGSALHVDGFRSLNLTAPIDHGNFENYSLSKYGHYGLKVDGESGSRDNSPNDFTAENPVSKYKSGRNTISGETNSLGFDFNSKVEQTSNKETKNDETRRQFAGIKTQVNEFISSLTEPQYYTNLRRRKYFGSLPRQGGLFLPQSAPKNVQTQSSSYGQPGSNLYFGVAQGQHSQIGTPYVQRVEGKYPTSQPVSSLISASAYSNDRVGASFQQGSYQGLHSNPGQPPVFGVSEGQGPYWQNNIQAPSAISPLTNNYGAVPGQDAQYQGNGISHSHGGQPTGYYGTVPDSNITPQNGQQGVPDQPGQVQGLYSGVGQPTNYYGTTIPRNHIQGQQGYYLIWPPSMGTPVTPGQAAGQITLLASQYNHQQYVPGLYGGVEKGLTLNPFGAGDPTLYSISRYMNTGFYYPPPQHLNSNPNKWDPESRYYFSFNGQELPTGAFSPSPPPNPFPMTY